MLVPVLIKPAMTASHPSGYLFISISTFLLVILSLRERRIVVLLLRIPLSALPNSSTLLACL